MKRPLVAIIFFFCLQLALANPLLNKGFPYIKSFDLAHLSSDLQNWMTVQAPNGFIYVANTSKLFEFDGINWKAYELPNKSALRSLATDSAGKIYVGGTREFGYFYPDQYGRMIYYSLSARLDQIQFESVWRILKTDNGVFFVTGRKYIYKYHNNKLTLVTAPPILGEFRASKVNGRIYFYDKKAGFGYIHNDTMRVYKKSLLPENYTAYFFMSDLQGGVLTGIRQHGLYQFDTTHQVYDWNTILHLEEEDIKQSKITKTAKKQFIRPVSSPLNRFLKKSVLYYGTINQGKYVLTTLKGGLVMADANFKIINTYHKDAGLSSDAIYHVNSDKQGGLWVAGEMGLSYIRYQHPFKYFNELNKINGIIISVKSLKDEILLGTTQGIYAINKQERTVDRFHEAELISDDYIYSLDMRVMEEEPHKVLISSLRHILLFDRDTRKLHNIASLYGTYEIEKAPFQRNVYFFGHTKGIKAYRILQNSKGNYTARALPVFKDFNENVRNLTFDKNNRLWVSTAFNGVFSIELDPQMNVKNIVKYDSSSGLEHNNGNYTFLQNDTLCVATPSGIMYYDDERSRFRGMPNLYKTPVFDSVSINAVLPAKTKIWFGLDKGAMYYDLPTKTLHTRAFYRLSNMGTEAIDQDSYGNIWLSGRNQLIAIDTSKLYNLCDSVPVKFREIKFGKDSLLPTPCITDYKNSHVSIGEIPFSHNSLSINIGCPAYNTIENITFSYKLKGLDENWSPWSPYTQVNYSYLPGGEYNFVIKAHDANKQIIGKATLAFTIARPFYLTVWAFIFYALIAGLFILLLIMLNSRRLKADKRKLQNRINEAISTVQQQKEELEAQAQFLAETNKELEKLSIVAEHTDNAVAIMDGKGNYQWINKGFTRMYGFRYDELNNDRDKIGKHSNLRINDLINIWFGDKKPIIYESLNRSKSGNERWVQTVLTPILDTSGNVSKLISIDTDISKLKEAEQKIEQQRDEITQQRDIAVKQRDEIIEQKQDITDSIRYAQRIQSALFPSKETLSASFDENFIFDLPRDIVSGDFFWIYRYEHKTLIAVADCTGHGVPGAFMSLIGLNFLNEIVITEKIRQPDKVLNQLRSKIIAALSQADRVGENKDGMDIALISFDHQTNTLNYAGANNAALVRRNNELIELEPDKMPISIYRDIKIPFNLKTLKTQPGDYLYMFTDGYTDQFGGKKEKKFKSNNFRKLLSRLPEDSMRGQEEEIRQKFYAWKGNLEQVDDVLVIGIKI